MQKASSSSVRPDRLAAAAVLALIGLGSISAWPAVSRAQPLLDLFTPLATDRPIGFFIADPTGVEGGHPGDAELCRWALADWARASSGRIEIEPQAESAALIRVYFASPESGQYGETRPIVVDGRRGAEVYVRPATDALGPEIAGAARADRLLRDTIVYLTCLHEIGHAFGLQHTDDFADVMYFFGYGGDIRRFFGRYRARLATRDDIRHTSGLSAGDVAQLERLYPEP